MNGVVYAQANCSKNLKSNNHCELQADSLVNALKAKPTNASNKGHKPHSGNKHKHLPHGQSPYTPTRQLVKNPAGTTIDKSIGIAKSKKSHSYKNLQYQHGWPLIIRQDLAKAQFGRNKRRQSLISFVHFTDMHISDAQSPERNPFARKFGIDYRTDFRNQEALTLQVADAMIQRVQSFTGGPATGKNFSFLISTGDNGDGRQMNELRNYINLLDGGFITADTSGEGYIGVQDDFYLPAYPEFMINITTLTHHHRALNQTNSNANMVSLSILDYYKRQPIIFRQQV